MREAVRALVVLLLLLGLTACTGSATTEPATTSSSASPSASPRRDFTVATTEPVTVLDPAAAADDPSAFLALHVFQRLMTTEPGGQLLRPDAAQDCQFKTPTVYECTLRQGLTFHLGGDLTSSDVKFSILRALRLGVDGTAISALGSLERIETPTPLLVRFVLRWPDTQFGFALASPACSIVNEELYNADAIRDPALLPSGSGPYMLVRSTDKDLYLSSFSNYLGPTAGTVSPITVAYYPDSAAVEDAMTANAVDYVWRGLSAAAVKRLTQQSRDADGRTRAGFGPVYLRGTRVHVLRWNPASPTRLDAGIRTAVAGALQDGRTLDSLIPPDHDGHVAAFAVGGSPSATPTLPVDRPRLTLSYAALAPDEASLARDIRDQIETRAGISVQLVPGERGADLRLTDTRPWVDAPVAWLAPYTAAAPPGSAQKVADLVQRYRSSTDKTVREAALAEIQKQAAADLVALPVSADDEVAFLAQGYMLAEPRFGPNFQLALWSIRKVER